MYVQYKNAIVIVEHEEQKIVFRFFRHLKLQAHQNYKKKEM